MSNAELVTSIIKASAFIKFPTLTVGGIINDIKTIKNEFCPNLTFEDVLIQETPYIEKYGMVGFDAGYAGLIKK